MNAPDINISQPQPDVPGFVAAVWPPANRDQEVLTWETLAGDGSDRTFIRVRAGSETAIVVAGPDKAENRSYELIGRHLWRLGRMGPEFMAVDQDRGLFLIEDLGDLPLQDTFEAVDEDGKTEMYQKALALLAGLHARGRAGFNPDWCFQTARYDQALILKRETGYFMSAFVRGYAGLTPETPVLAGEFKALAEAALDKTEATLMHRDFQSRNIMIKDNRPRLVDFQGARLGPPGYDLASLLYDPYVQLGDDRQIRLREYYLDLRSRDKDFNAAAFTAAYPRLAACRLLQALGAFGFLSRVKGKAKFESYIPPALLSLDRLLNTKELGFMPELGRLVRLIRSRME